MNIGTNIKKIRRQRDMTQEELAERLGVSVSAVSQWELEKTSPDLSLIPPICSLFNVTSDELLGIDLAQKEAKIERILSRAQGYSSRGYNPEARTILEAGLKEFPDAYAIVYDLMYIAQWQSGETDKYSADERGAFQKEAIALGERICNGCTDDWLRHGAIQILCFTYRDIGELDKAVALAKTMPCLACSYEALLSGVQNTGTQGYKNLQSELYNLFQFFERDMVCVNYRLDSGEPAYTEDEMAALRDKQLALFDLIFENGDYGFFNTHLADTHRCQASFYAKKKNTAKTLSHLTSAADCAIEFTKNLGAVKRTSLLFRGFAEGSCFSTSNSDNDAAVVLKALASSEFDFIRESDAFKKITERLSQYGGKWKTE